MSKDCGSMTLVGKLSMMKRVRRSMPRLEFHFLILEEACITLSLQLFVERMLGIVAIGIRFRAERQEQLVVVLLLQNSLNHTLPALCNKLLLCLVNVCFQHVRFLDVLACCSLIPMSVNKLYGQMLRLQGLLLFSHQHHFSLFFSIDLSTATHYSHEEELLTLRTRSISRGEF